MRTLLIDNHDSYTYNLAQLLAEVAGVPPTVILNDESSLDALDEDAFDAVVISPGPGTPKTPRDFGLCRDVLSGWHLPVLGVCLGHQGMALLAGGDVRPAPRPRHGHVSRIWHDGRGLFAGVPQGFAAVRYHSLCTPDPLPATLRVTARAEDGVVMALRHLRRPWWGVQFHPESVATEHGRLVLANFRRLVERRASSRRHRGGVGAAARPVTTAVGGTGAPVGLRLRWLDLPYAVDAEAAFCALYGQSRYAFWLDSSQVTPGRSRYSFMGDASGPLGEVLSYRVGTGHVERTGALGDSSRLPGTIFDVLGRRLAERRLSEPVLPFDLTGGYVGFFGYELKADCGSPGRHISPTPDAVWIFAHRVICVDHEARRTHVMALEPVDRDGGAMDWVRQTAHRLDLLPEPPVLGDAPPWAEVIADPGSWLARDRDRYLEAIATCRRLLAAGESYEICLTDRLRVRAHVSGLRLHRHLRRLNPAPYGAFLRCGSLAITSSSPERFLKVDRSGVVESQPIKGTARRAHDPEEDLRLRLELASNPKERAENLMIVDLVRNDLGRVCEVGSVEVPRFMVVESYATVHQLVSTIRGRLAPGTSAIDCIRACFPGGSMTGAPKRRTMEILDALETDARGIYSGALGYLGVNGAADLSIVIRTAVLRDGEMTIGGGGAIVLDSDPEREYAEMLLKVAMPLRALIAAAWTGHPDDVWSEPSPWRAASGDPVRVDRGGG